MIRAITKRVNIFAARAWALGLTGIIAFAALSSYAAGFISMEYRVKAACLYNFVKFVDWPSSASQASSNPIVIGILGDDPFDGNLDEIVRGHKANGRAIQIKRSARLDDLKGCDVLFISNSEQQHVAGILKSLEGQSVLTVGDAKDFLAQGGAINFLIQENKVRFEINLGAAQKANLKIDSQLLSLATSVLPASAGKEN